MRKYGFNLSLDTSIGEGEAWKRSNWISIEFDLLYRWHSLIPNELAIGSNHYGLPEFRNNPKLLLKHGVEKIIHAASMQRAGQIGLMNTHEMFFVPLPLVEKDIETNSSIQFRTVKMARDARLQPYNAYRKAFGLKPLKNFEALTDDPLILDQLRKLYGDIDALEWFVGIFAEKPAKGE